MKLTNTLPRLLMGQGDQDISLRRILGAVGYFLFCACIEPEYVRNLLSRVENIARKRPGPNHNKTDPLKNRRLTQCVTV
jgi:hypothetical protein